MLLGLRMSMGARGRERPDIKLENLALKLAELANSRIRKPPGRTILAASSKLELRFGKWWATRIRVTRSTELGGRPVFSAVPGKTCTLGSEAKNRVAIDRCLADGSIK